MIQNYDKDCNDNHEIQECNKDAGLIGTNNTVHDIDKLMPVRCIFVGLALLTKGCHRCYGGTL